MPIYPVLVGVAAGLGAGVVLSADAKKIVLVGAVLAGVYLYVRAR